MFFLSANARVDRRVLLHNGRVATDYAGGPAGPTVGSHRVAEWANRWTKSTRAFAPRSGANSAAHRPQGHIPKIKLPENYKFLRTFLSSTAPAVGCSRLLCGVFDLLA